MKYLLFFCSIFFFFSFYSNGQEVSTFFSPPPPIELPDPDNPNDIIIMGNWKGISPGPNGTLIVECGSAIMHKCMTIKNNGKYQDSNPTLIVYDENKNIVLQIKISDIKEEIQTSFRKFFVKTE